MVFSNGLKQMLVQLVLLEPVFILKHFAFLRTIIFGEAVWIHVILFLFYVATLYSAGVSKIWVFQFLEIISSEFYESSSSLMVTEEMKLELALNQTQEILNYFFPSPAQNKKKNK